MLDNRQLFQVKGKNKRVAVNTLILNSNKEEQNKSVLVLMMQMRFTGHIFPRCPQLVAICAHLNDSSFRHLSQLLFLWDKCDCLHLFGQQRENKNIGEREGDRPSMSIYLSFDE